MAKEVTTQVNLDNDPTLVQDMVRFIETCPFNQVVGLMSRLAKCTKTEEPAKVPEEDTDKE